MKDPFKILFYEDGDPIDTRCIRRFNCAFSKSYQEVVRKIIEKSAVCNRDVFGFNVATLMPSFRMTRVGAFHGVRINNKGIVSDPKGVIESCWDQVGAQLQKLRNYVDENTCKSRNRVLADLSPAPRDYVIEKTAELFEELRKVTVGTSKVGRVAASKVLFAIFPEIALPVDNIEWDHVFKTEKYLKILSTMVSEIDEWERKSKKHLDNIDLKNTLPGIYNVMAMAARPLRS